MEQALFSRPGPPAEESRTSRVAVCVPVRNERDRLPAMLDALRGQRTGIAAVCLFFDGCTDDSEAVAGQAAGDLRLVTRRGPPGDANAGRARRAATALGLDVVAGIDDALLLTTDADSVPAPDWIAAAACSLRSCDVVAGRIVRETGGDPQERLEAYYDRLYALRRALDSVAWEPEAGHHFTGGANLGFRAEAYRAVGGFAELASGEDAAIVDECARAGLRVRRDARVVVRTSTRRDGRAANGLAALLARMDDTGDDGPEVGDPGAAAWQYRRHAAARAAFAGLPRGAEALGRMLGLSAAHVAGVARDCPNAEAFAMRIVPAAPNAGRTMPLAEAERALAQLERQMMACVA